LWPQESRRFPGPVHSRGSAAVPDASGGRFDSPDDPPYHAGERLRQPASLFRLGTVSTIRGERFFREPVHGIFSGARAAPVGLIVLRRACAELVPDVGHARGRICQRHGVPPLPQLVLPRIGPRPIRVFALPGRAGYNQSSPVCRSKMVLLIALLLCGFRILDAQDFDLILRNGRIVDGMGNPWYRADVGVRDGRIAAIGDLRERAAGRVIALNEQVIAPGFIDMMAGTSIPLLQNPASGSSKLQQGITTMMAGEGGSDAPQGERS